ncbi:MAG: DUF1801 domain-containing protein [Arenimonas sp.]
MAENKTKVTDASVDAYLSAIENDARRKDCEAIAALMARITKCPPKMWGSSIVGFDTYHYKYASGREGDACVAGFSSRKGDISVYLTGEGVNQEQLLAKLGRHKMGKCCLYIRKLEDIDMVVLEKLISESVTEMKRRYG